MTTVQGYSIGISGREWARVRLPQPTPWGRPGPGGALWRDPKLLGARFLESMGWTNNSIIDKIYKRNMNPLTVTDMNKFYDDKATPGIASETQPLQDSRNPYKEEIQVYELTGGVELVPLLTGRPYQSHPQTTRYLATDATRPGYMIESVLILYFIWGRPGHGAPIDHAQRNNLYNILHHSAIY
ncbi:uncharacterized protein [Polyergus mexicanus]|uniref:uncharacterized protein n=1 Tax=Polyergus mexicanus TaxID=615972 RepID=UPI0038B67E0A